MDVAPLLAAGMLPGELSSFRTSMARPSAHIAGMRALFVVPFLVALATQATADGMARVNRRVCDRLVEHEPAPGIRYEAGVDARGRPVVPADVGRAPVALPSFGVDVLIPWPRSTDAGGQRAGGDIYAGTVTVGRDGTVLFDGRPLQPAEEAYIAAECRRAGLR